MQQREHFEQVAFVNWCKSPFTAAKYPGVDEIFAIANGGARHIAVARKLKAEGVTAGIPDLMIPVPVGALHGLFVEMKSETGRLSQDQKKRIDSLNARGYRAVVAQGCLEAMSAVESYFAS